MSAVRTDGDREGWVGFFLDGVEAAAGEAERGIVTELTGQKKNRGFSDAACVALLARDT